MGTHPIFESDFDCLTEMTSRIPQHQHVADLTKSQTRVRIESGGAILIDVRRFDEVDAGVIKSDKWIHIPLNELEEALELDDEDFAAHFDAQKPSVNDELVFYCMKGVRSRNAALYFQQNKLIKLNVKLFNSIKGFTNVSNYGGGWWEWNNHWTRAEWVAWSEKANYPLPDYLLDTIDN